MIIPGISGIKLIYYSSLDHTESAILYVLSPFCCASASSDLTHFSLCVNDDKVVFLYLCTDVTEQSEGLNVDVVMKSYCTSTRDCCAEEDTSL